jgi:hypothetical protein
VTKNPLHKVKKYIYKKHRDLAKFLARKTFLFCSVLQCCGSRPF